MKLLRFFIISSLLFSVAYAQFDSVQPETSKLSPDFSAANAAAIHFLNIVDNRQYQGAWLDMGPIIKDLVPQDVWGNGMASVRKVLGNVLTRKVTGHQNMTSLPSGIRGAFMAIRYQTQFAQKANASETVILMEQPKIGQWYVISYQIGR